MPTPSLISLTWDHGALLRSVISATLVSESGTTLRSQKPGASHCQPSPKETVLGLTKHGIPGVTREHTLMFTSASSHPALNALASFRPPHHHSGGLPPPQALLLCKALYKEWSYTSHVYGPMACPRPSLACSSSRACVCVCVNPWSAQI